MTRYTVRLNDFHGGKLIYHGKSLTEAVRASRRHDCTKGGDCVAGPVLSRIADDGTTDVAYDWHAAKPFQQATEIIWVEMPV